ncbi:MAG: acyl-CoA desaturase [Actinomycetota bacterium]|nr:fatty acid desaturase [Actinomycetota bacterium]
MTTDVLERPSATQEIRGVIRLTARELRMQRRVTLLLTVLPPIGVALAIFSLWGHGIGTRDLSIMGAFYAFTGIGVTVGYHRLFTHRSFTAVPGLRVLFAVAGSMSVEGSLIAWVATHRRHHAFADEFGDPHSPHLARAAGLRGVLLGLWHAHMGWLFDSEKSNQQEWAPDLLAEPVIKKIDERFLHLTIMTFVLPALIGFVLRHSFGGMMSAFLWGSLVRVFLLHHVTWSINSVCHFYGKEAFKARDESRNVWPMSAISFGESWHNNHHAFPWSARLGLRAWQVDPGWYVIRFFSGLRMITGVKVPTAKQMEAKRIS